MHKLPTSRRARLCVAAALGLANSTAVAGVPAAASGPAIAVTGAVAIVVLLAILKREHLLAAVRAASSRDENALIAAALRAANYASLADFVVPRPCNELAHIDHAVRTSAGIVCVRVKALCGHVTGAPTDPQWTVSAGGKQQHFLNPLIQNEGRVAALRELLPDVPVSSLVVLAGPVTFDTALAGNVIDSAEMLDWLRRFEQQRAATPGLDAAWQALRANARTDADSLRDFHAQLNFG